MQRQGSNYGFTLIEMSIVLVVIGLIVGGILVGQDLIRASEVRAQITQIEKFNQAVNTFRGKYGVLPGDMNTAAAATFGFTPRGSQGGQGDGNGIIEGYGGDCAGNHGTSANSCGWGEGAGETLMFWVDLTYANGMNLGFIEGTFSAASPTSLTGTITSANVYRYFPVAKIGTGNYVSVWSGGTSASAANTVLLNGINYYNIVAATGIKVGGELLGTATIPVRQAYAIDSKIDDGLPQSGTVTAVIMANPSALITGNNWAAGAGTNGALSGHASTGSATTCYDNGGSASTAMAYSLEINNGAGANCALSFQFQ